MKDRATVLCVRDDRILLVARERSRWALPGGRIRRDEAPHEAALRELEEETTLVADDLAYLFRFYGFNAQHHVFFAELGPHLTALPSNEIAKCNWFAPVKIATLSASVPTRGIVELFFLPTHRRCEAGRRPADVGAGGPDDPMSPWPHLPGRRR
ncbi:NUDIX domain-containing protein [Paraburkholderia youngii]|uniref:NUDIX domain-containing protein n=1 Tax=Paraburkholderia youngii TaxID=2782701 RepID=UPI003D1D10F4